MPEDDKKFFDVSKSHKVGPHPTSKPIIVGHHPMMPDPMIKEESDEAPAAQKIPINIKTDELQSKQDSLPNLADISSSQEPIPALTPFMQHSSSTSESTSPELYTPHETQVPPADIQPLPPTAKIPSPPEPPTGNDAQLHVPAGHAAYHHKPRVWVWVIVALVLLGLIYAAIDAKTDILPLHIFNHSKNNQSASQAITGNNSQTSQSTNQQTLPAGFARYQPVGSPLIFAYPTTWGTPTTNTDPGFSQRGGTKKSDGTHAYLISFATNKDVEIAITSSKYLPAARTALYYDFLQWCVGTNDGKFYKQLLHFTTASGVDSPSTTSCDQGPLADATKINNAIIVQLKTKDANGAVLGDVYTANLSDATLPVIRVKDAKMQSSDDIKKLLSTISGASQ